MPTQVTGLASPRGIGKPVVGIYGPALQAFPLTAAVVLGPLITIVYRLTQSSDAALGSFSLAQAVRGLLCPLMFLSLYFARGLHRVTHRLVHPLFFLAAYAVATAPLGPYPYQNVVAAVKLVFLSLVFLNTLQLAAAGVVRERWLTTCAWAILLIMAICIGIGLMTADTSVGYTSRYATAGLMNHISIASFFVLSTLPVFLRDTVVSRSAVAGVGIVWLLLFFTMCRTALITAVAGTCGPLLLGLTRLGSRIPWRKVLVWLGLVLLLTAIGLSTAPGAELTTRFRELNPYAGSGSGRYTFWKISLEHILYRPVSAQLWGDGMGSTRDVLKARFGLPIGCHNDWLEFVTAFGVCGLVGMGWWHFELLRLAWRFRRRQEGLSQGVWAAAIVLVLISLGTGGSFDPVWALIYAALGFWAGHTVWAQQSGSTDALPYDD